MIVTTDSGDGYLGVNNEEQPMKECVIRRCQTLEKRELTAGPWEVKDEKVCYLKRHILFLRCVKYLQIKAKII